MGREAFRSHEAKTAEIQSSCLFKSALVGDLNNNNNNDNRLASLKEIVHLETLVIYDL